MKKIIFSLDLGRDTLKMCYAYKDGGKAVSGILQLLDDSDYMPAVALYDLNNDKWFFGADALINAEDSQRPIVRIKDLIDKSVDENYYNGYDFENTDYAYKFKSVTLSVKQVLENCMSYVLVDLVGKALAKLEFTEEEISNRVMFSFNAEMSDGSKIVLKRLIQSLGFKVRAITEPTAAAAACVYDGVKIGREVMVVDLGVLSSSLAVFNPSKGLKDSLGMIATETINYGGKDFDNIIFDYVVSQSGKEEEITNYQKFKITEQIRSAKESLCAGEAEVILEYQSDSVVYVNVTIEQFIESSKEIMSNITNSILAMLEGNAGVRQVVLTGGTSKNPYLVDFITEAVVEKHPKIQVAKLTDGIFGVAMGTAIISTGVMKFRSIATKGYGFACYNSYGQRGMQIVINKNDRLPIAITRKVSTKDKDQDSIIVNVFSSTKKTERNEFITPLGVTEHSLQKTQVQFPEKVKKGTTILVTIFIDEDGIGGVKIVGPKGKGMYKKSFDAN